MRPDEHVDADPRDIAASLGTRQVSWGEVFSKTWRFPLALGVTSRPTNAGVILLVAMVIFIASFAFSLGPVVWTVINEIYPGTVRSRRVALATAANWGAAWLVTQFFLTLTDWIGESGTFFLFAAMCAVGFAFVWFLVPETKGKTLAQIQQMSLARAGERVPEASPGSAT